MYTCTESKIQAQTLHLYNRGQKGRDYNNERWWWLGLEDPRGMLVIFFSPDFFLTYGAIDTDAYFCDVIVISVWVSFIMNINLGYTLVSHVYATDALSL